MGVVKVIVTVIQVILAIALIVAVVMQSGRSAGLSGVISGGAETLFGKKKGMDELLGKITVVVAILFGAVCLLLVVWE